MQVAGGEAVGTHFLPAADRVESRRRYLLSRLQSRGRVVVDDGAARALLRENVQTLGLGGSTKIYRRDATKLGPAELGQFSLVFLDPPYGKGLAEKALASAREGGWLAPGALVVVEEETSAAFKPPDGFEELERRDYDDTQFTFLRVK